MTDPKIILRLPASAGDADVFLRSPWSERWAETTRETAAQLEARLGSFLRLKPGMAVPYLGGSGAAIWIGDIEQLDLVLAEGCWTTIVFDPTRAAVLDAIGLARRGLVARRALKSGDVLTAADVDTVAGGPGLSEAMLPALLGQKLCYDLNAGEPITFGMIAVGTV